MREQMYGSVYGAGASGESPGLGVSLPTGFALGGPYGYGYSYGYGYPYSGAGLGMGMGSAYGYGYASPYGYSYGAVGMGRAGSAHGSGGGAGGNPALDMDREVYENARRALDWLEHGEAYGA